MKENMKKVVSIVIVLIVILLMAFMVKKFDAASVVKYTGLYRGENYGTIMNLWQDGYYHFSNSSFEVSMEGQWKIENNTIVFTGFSETDIYADVEEWGSMVIIEITIPWEWGSFDERLKKESN